MALWVEIQCDIGRSSDSKCRSFHNDNIAQHISNVRSRAPEQLGDLEVEAYKEGWRKIHGLWYCDRCMVDWRKANGPRD